MTIPQQPSDQAQRLRHAARPERLLGNAERIRFLHVDDDKVTRLLSAQVSLTLGEVVKLAREWTSRKLPVSENTDLYRAQNDWLNRFADELECIARGGEPI